jgi:hypothetical protein
MQTTATETRSQRAGTCETRLLVRRSENSWFQNRSSSSAFYHCLSVCGHVLQVMDGVTRDLQSWRVGGAAASVSLQGAISGRNCTPQTPHDSPLRGSVLEALPGVDSTRQQQQLGQDWTLLLDTMPKVQATGCRCESLSGGHKACMRLMRSARGQHLPSVQACDAHGLADQVCERSCNGRRMHAPRCSTRDSTVQSTGALQQQPRRGGWPQPLLRARSASAFPCAAFTSPRVAVGACGVMQPRVC